MKLVHHFHILIGFVSLLNLFSLEYYQPLLICHIEVRYMVALKKGDHFFLQAKFRYRITKPIPSQTRGTKKLILEKLKDPTVQERYWDEIIRQMATINNGMVEGHWNNIKTITMEAAKEVIGVKKRQRKKVCNVDRQSI